MRDNMSNENNDENNDENDNKIPEIKTWENDFVDFKDNLLRGIFAYGFDEPSPIQSKSIIPLIDGKDIIAQAQSGTGKTGAFVISTLEIIDDTIPQTQAIIMAPTRELARQIFEVIQSIGKFLNYHIYLLIGGTSTEHDKNSLSNETPHIIVGCPGRIHDMIKRNFISTDYIKLLILDEADEMLSSGFKEQVYTIFQFLNSSIQVGLFSATMPPELFTLTEKFLRNPISILVKKDALTLQGILQYYINLEGDQQKFSTLKDIYARLTMNSCIIYCNSIKRVKDLYEAMLYDKYPVARIHGDMTDEERKETCNDFRNGKVRVLISSNVTARGLDVQQVSVVINFDLPKDANIYLHRIGRSGRWGRKGLSINFVTRRDQIKLKEIEKFYSTTIDELPENFEKSITNN
jgi:translation initiation factor 4A